VRLSVHVEQLSDIIDLPDGMGLILCKVLYQTDWRYKGDRTNANSEREVTMYWLKPTITVSITIGWGKGKDWYQLSAIAESNPDQASGIGPGAEAIGSQVRDWLAAAETGMRRIVENLQSHIICAKALKETTC